MVHSNQTIATYSIIRYVSKKCPIVDLKSQPSDPKFKMIASLQSHPGNHASVDQIKPSGDYGDNVFFSKLTPHKVYFITGGYDNRNRHEIDTLIINGSVGYKVKKSLIPSVEKVLMLDLKVTLKKLIENSHVVRFNKEYDKVIDKDRNKKDYDPMTFIEKIDYESKRNYNNRDKKKVTYDEIDVNPISSSFGEYDSNPIM